MPMLSALASEGCVAASGRNGSFWSTAQPPARRADTRAMAFEDSKKYFPAPEVAPAKPKEKPQPLETGRAMSFNGVVGRTSLYIPTKLTNPNGKAVEVRLETVGSEFELKQPMLTIAAMESGANNGDARIRYRPTTPGTTEGELRIRSTFDGESEPSSDQVLVLRGTATTLEHPTPTPSDGAPRPIPDLESASRPASLHDRLQRDLDASTGLAETYTSIVEAGDAVVAEMSRRINHSIRAFGDRVGRWAEAEIESTKGHNRSWAWSALLTVLGKGFDHAFEKLKYGSVVNMVVGWVVEHGFDLAINAITKDRGELLRRSQALVATDGAEDLVSLENAWVHEHLSLLMLRIEAKREVASQLAGIGAMDRISAAQSAPAGEGYEPRTTPRTVAHFRDELDGYSDGVRALSALALQLEPSLERSFDSLRMHYLRAHAEKSTSGACRIEYQVSWDLGTEREHDAMIVHNRLIAGYASPTEDMRTFIATRSLSQLAKVADISVQLDCKQGGGVVLEKRLAEQGGDKDAAKSGESSADANAAAFRFVSGPGAVRAAMYGAEGFWKLLLERL